MPDDDGNLLPLVAAALRDLLDYVNDRSDDATPDDDVRALESAAYVLQQVEPDHRARLIELLGPKHADGLGLSGS